MRIKANYTGTTVKVNTLEVQGLFLPNGQVGQHAKRVAQTIKHEAMRQAPTRTGALRALHKGPKYSVSKYGGHVTIWNTSPYARFVHDGTTGPILPRNPTGYLWVRPIPHSRFPWRQPMKSVSGQRAQPWMADAMRLVIRIVY